MLRSQVADNTVVLFAVHDFFAEVVLDGRSAELLKVNAFLPEQLPLPFFRIFQSERPILSAISEYRRTEPSRAA
jgi:hypothetical protein